MFINFQILLYDHTNSMRDPGKEGIEEEVSWRPKRQKDNEQENRENKKKFLEEWQELQPQRGAGPGTPSTRYMSMTTPPPSLTPKLPASEGS